MNRLLQVTGQVQAALASLAEDQPDVQNTLAKLHKSLWWEARRVARCILSAACFTCSRDHRLQSCLFSQSAGKSTLLESFISEKFLPTGPEMVTRRPIIISLVTAPNVNFPVKTFQDPKAPGVPASTPIVDPGLTYSSLLNDLLLVQCCMSDACLHHVILYAHNY